MATEKEMRGFVTLLLGVGLASGCRSAPEEVFPAVATSAAGAGPTSSALGPIADVVPDAVDLDPGAMDLHRGSGPDAVLDREAQALWNETGSERARLYREARRLEAEGRYDNALEHYGALLEKDPEHADAAERHRTLIELSGLAEDCYAWALESLAETDVDSTLYFLRQIQLFWPGYQDVDRQIAALEEAGGN